MMNGTCYLMLLFGVQGGVDLRMLYYISFISYVSYWMVLMIMIIHFVRSSMLQIISDVLFYIASLSDH